VKEFTIPTNVYAASYLPDKNIFVCGGEDFVIYRYEYSYFMYYYIQYTNTFNALMY